MAKLIAGFNMCPKCGYEVVRREIGYSICCWNCGVYLYIPAYTDKCEIGIYKRKVGEDGVWEEYTADILRDLGIRVVRTIEELFPKFN